MSTIQHVVLVPFPQGGHGINNMHLASRLASPQTQVHILLCSLVNGQQWLEASGHNSLNPDIHLFELAQGKWSDHNSYDARALFQTVKSTEYESAIKEFIEALKAQGKTPTALVINAIMSGLCDVGEMLGLRTYVLMPVCGAMGRLSAACVDDEDPRKEFSFKGIGVGKKSGKDLILEAGDFVDGYGLMRSMVMGSYNKAVGMIETNTNAALEGDQREQNHLPEIFKRPKEWSIGPIVADWFQKVAKGDEGERRRHALESGGEVLRFLDTRKENSTVYVTTGSHMELELEQAKLIISELRKWNVNWVLVYRNDTNTIRQLLGGDDGVVTAWSPQLDIMVHPAIKCIISHGGFGTMIEGIYGGKPFITAPVSSDQFVDSKIMLHLGISLGCIAENEYMSIQRPTKLVPKFKDDGGKQIKELIKEVFGSKEGELALEKASEQSRALRDAFIQEQETNGVYILKELRKDMSRAI